MKGQKARVIDFLTKEFIVDNGRDYIEVYEKGGSCFSFSSRII